jgi:hypothetical protein
MLHSTMKDFHRAIFLLLLLLLIPPFVSSSGAVIGNGKVILGVTEYGSLNIPYVGNVLGLPANDPTQTQHIGLRNGDGLIGQFTFVEGRIPNEGWGAGVKIGSSFTNVCGFIGRTDIYRTSVSLTNFTGINGGSTATSIVDCGTPDLLVTHDFKPSLQSPDLMQVNVKISNIGANDFDDVQYRRVTDFDVDPTPIISILTHLGTTTTSSLIFSTNYGICDPRPNVNCTGNEFVGRLYNVDFNNHLSRLQGSTFQFSFGKLNAGTSKTFQFFYGLSEGRVAAETATQLVQAELVSYAQPSNSTDGFPYTAILAFAGVGGTALTNNRNLGWLSDEIRVVRAKTSRQIVLGTLRNGDTINATTMYRNRPVSLMIVEEVCCMKYVNITYEGNTKREGANPFALLGNTKRNGFREVPSLYEPGIKNIYIIGQTKQGGLIRKLNITFTVVV